MAVLFVALPLRDVAPILLCPILVPRISDASLTFARELAPELLFTRPLGFLEFVAVGLGSLMMAGRGVAPV